MGQFVSRLTGYSTGEATVTPGVTKLKPDKQENEAEAQEEIVNGSHTNGKGEEEVTSSGENDSLTVHPSSESTLHDITLDSNKTIEGENPEANDDDDTEDDDSINPSNGFHHENGSNGHEAEMKLEFSSRAIHVFPPDSEDSHSESSSNFEAAGGDVSGVSGGRKRRKSPRSSPNKRPARASPVVPDDRRQSEDRPFGCSYPGCEWAFKALFHLNRHRKAVHGILEPLTMATFALTQQQDPPSGHHQEFDELQDQALIENILDAHSSGHY